MSNQLIYAVFLNVRKISGGGGGGGEGGCTKQAKFSNKSVEGAEK